MICDDEAGRCIGRGAGALYVCEEEEVDVSPALRQGVLHFLDSLPQDLVEL